MRIASLHQKRHQLFEYAIGQDTKCAAIELCDRFIEELEKLHSFFCYPAINATAIVRTNLSRNQTLSFQPVNHSRDTRRLFNDTLSDG